MLINRQRVVGIMTGLVLFAALPVMAAEQTLVIGIFPRQKSTVTFKCFTPLAQYLSRELHREVILETASDFTAFMAALNTARYDVVHFNQYHYVRSHKTLGYNVIAMNEEAGKATIRGTVAVNKNSGVNSVQQLRDSKIMFGGGREAMMSYIVPTFLLRQAGLHKGEYVEEFARNPVNALLAVHYGQAKAAGVGKVVVKLPAMSKRYQNHVYTYLLTSEPLAHLPWAVKADMPNTLSQQIQHVLISLKDSQQGRNILKEANLTGLIPAKDADYDRHREIISAVLGEQY